MMQHEATVTSIQERHVQLEGTIMQRLKWAGGANPSLNNNLSQFEEALTAKNAIIQVRVMIILLDYR